MPNPIKKETKTKALNLFRALKDVKPVYEKLIKDGHNITYPELVELFDSTPLAEAFPLKKTVEDEKRKRRKRKPKQLDEMLENSTPLEVSPSLQTYIHQTFLKLLLFKAREKGWAYEQTARYDHHLGNGFDRTLKILQAYETLTNTGQYPSTYRISIEANTQEASVRKVLSKLNLPFGDTTIQIDETLEKAINNALKIEDLNLREAAYFLRIPSQDLTKHLKKNGQRFKQKYCNLSTPSQIYEAQDAGFTQKEIAQYAKSSLKSVEHHIRHRKEFEQEIIKVLKQIYPEQEITKPYIKQQ